MWIHSVFHIFLLKSADLKTLLQIKVPEIDLKSQNVKFKVKKVLGQ